MINIGPRLPEVTCTPLPVSVQQFKRIKKLSNLLVHTLRVSYTVSQKPISLVLTAPQGLPTHIDNLVSPSKVLAVRSIPCTELQGRMTSGQR